jgi:tetratricopeptide (TPR) repeat protein
MMSFRSENYPEARRFGEAARVLAEEVGDARLLLESLSLLGALDQHDGALEEAERKFREAIVISDGAGLREATALTRVWIGAGANWRGEFRRAIAISREAEVIAAGVHDSVAELAAVAFRVLAHIGLGEYRDALDAIAGGLAKARERDNGFIQGRLGNTLGWLHQELGDFEGALALDQESAELGKRIGNPNVEISALINVAYDHLHLGQPRRALPLLEETATRVEKFAFGAHRWRWSNHLSACLAETLLVAGDPGRALTYADRGLAQGQATGSRKYIARCQALRGAIALEMGDGRRAEADLAEALRLTCEIEYPTLTWQAAHLLARAQAAQGKMEAAFASASLAVDVIDHTVARIPEAALRTTFAAWPRVQAVREDLERLRRA